MRKIFVMGGTGFVGRHVCEKLVRQGWHVTVPTRRLNNAKAVQHLPGLTVQELDVHHAASLAQAIAGHDAVVNLVAILHGSQAAFEKVHISLPKILVQACQDAGVKQVVHISALGVNASNPQASPSNYLRSKGLGEQALAQADLNLSILRPSVIFGAEDQFLNLFAKLQKVFPVMPLAGADARFQPVWVQDVAAAVVQALQPFARGNQHKVYELCGPDIYTLGELVQLAARLSSTTGRTRPVIPLPLWMGRVQALLMECAPGQPLMSRDNLDSMKVPNVATGKLPDLQSLGINATALEPEAREYLARHA
jgi:uncharacterized protein YbjT (DUF2867 family)